ncbi:MAG: hypothetical protein KF746_07740 [Chitinophagaceae bacterium]|nr:hypothetical protein [Chitinophagaceae bacterium]
MKMLIVMLTGLLCCMAGSSACRKDKPVVINSDTGIVLLRDASLNQVRFTMTGNWKIHYMYGGFTGHQKVELQNSYLKFLSNDSLYITFSNQPTTACKAKFVRKETEYGFTAWCMEWTYVNGMANELIVDHIYKDTLALSENGPDSFGYFMTKY